MIRILKILAPFTVLVFTGCDEPLGEKKTKHIIEKSKMDPRLKAYPEAVEWYKNSSMDKVSAFNLGVLYHTKIKDYKKSIIWYERAINMGYKNAYNNLGVVNEYLGNYNLAIKYYLELNSIDSITNLGLLYNKKLKDYPNAKRYYKIAIERESIKSINSIATLYNEQGKNIKASGYLLTLIEYSDYTKKEVLNHLRNDLKIDDETIKKGYELQLTMPGLPRRYKGGI